MPSTPSTGWPPVRGAEVRSRPDLHSVGRSVGHLPEVANVPLLAGSAAVGVPLSTGSTLMTTPTRGRSFSGALHGVDQLEAQRVSGHVEVERLSSVGDALEGDRERLVIAPFHRMAEGHEDRPLGRVKGYVVGVSLDCPAPVRTIRVARHKVQAEVVVCVKYCWAVRRDGPWE